MNIFDTPYYRDRLYARDAQALREDIARHLEAGRTAPHLHRLLEDLEQMIACAEARRSGQAVRLPKRRSR